MKFWEGAIIVIGGIWLIGRISRTDPNHPLNTVKGLGLPSPSVGPGGATVGTNTDGSSSLTAGETLAPAPPIGSGAVPVNSTPPLMSAPDPGCATCGGSTPPFLSSGVRSGAIVSSVGSIPVAPKSKSVSYQVCDRYGCHTETKQVLAL